jgi:2-amino-4-hydroxy-6-hydroxymethyldihydropteridine diphosphokinase
MVDYRQNRPVLIALGANLPSELFGPPRATLESALEMLPQWGITPVARSSWYASAPVPAGDQPWFVNGVVEVRSDLPPGAVLRALHEIEAALGRVREGAAVNAPRAADLDLLDYRGLATGEGDWPRLPHPRLHERAFVLLPLGEVAPEWRHPVYGLAADALFRRLDAGQECHRLPA